MPTKSQVCKLNSSGDIVMTPLFHQHNTLEEHENIGDEIHNSEPCSSNEEYIKAGTLSSKILHHPNEALEIFISPSGIRTSSHDSTMRK
ncbi:hypothetical protein TNCV_501411 [Trichonephila clavipes]|nr:hypothetical protein TNCV_501411 [Trichonephila clavipes]